MKRILRSVSALAVFLALPSVALAQNIPISGLPALSGTPTQTDVLPIVNAGVTKKITVGQMTKPWIWNCTSQPECVAPLNYPLTFSNGVSLTGGYFNSSAWAISSPLCTDGGGNEITSGCTVPVGAITGVLPLANGGTGTSSPICGVNGTNINVSGAFPNTCSWSTVAAPTFSGLVTATSGLSSGGPFTGAQTGSSATPSTLFYYNLFTINNDAVNSSMLRGNSAVNGFGVNLNFGGGATGSRTAIYGVTTLTSPASLAQYDYVGVIGAATAASADGGTAGVPTGNFFGGNFNTFALSGATYINQLTGIEIDTGINTGASAQNRWGLSLVSNGNLQAIGSDVALPIYGLNVGWKKGIELRSGGAFGIGTTGTFIGTDGTVATIGTYIDGTNLTVTGNIFNFPGAFTVSGAGAVTGSTFLANAAAGTAFYEFTNVAGGSNITALYANSGTVSGVTGTAFSIYGVGLGSPQLASMDASGNLGIKGSFKTGSSTYGPTSATINGPIVAVGADNGLDLGNGSTVFRMSSDGRLKLTSQSGSIDMGADALTNITTLNASGLGTFVGLTAGTGTVQGSSNGSAVAYVAPTYGLAGASLGSTTHDMVGSCTIGAGQTTCTATLSGASPFTSTTSYSCSVSLATGASVTGTLTGTFAVNTSTTVVTLNEVGLTIVSGIDTLIAGCKGF
jgi:hypothetical protein